MHNTRVRPFKFKELYNDLRNTGWDRWSCFVFAVAVIVSPSAKTVETY